MKTVLEFLDARWMQILGYTLLHSLWQALAIACIVILLVRLIPNKASGARYIVSSLGLVAIVVLSIGTFAHLYGTTATITTPTMLVGSFARELTNDANASVMTYVDNARALVQFCMPLFLLTWIVGTSIFYMRIVAGLAYVEKLRRRSTLLQNDWSDYLQRMSRQLNINRFISLAESNLIQAPVIIGHLKPMILIPIGMCTSLSTEQLETIFLHEMAHIRRRDYLINLMQVSLEAIYFFNPFVWIISGIMKREREHCCDDTVVQLHGSAREYAQALATLEELRLSKAGLSLSIAENRNELLNRIKRLMEKSVKNYSGREKVVPALLLVIGLICASWISTQSSRSVLSTTSGEHAIVTSDTVKKGKKIKPSKKAEAKTNDGLIEEPTPYPNGVADGIENTEFETEYAMRFYQGAPPLPPFEDEILSVPGFPPLAMPFNFDMMLHELDTPRLSGTGNWERFGREFEEEFKAKFGDFYEKHQEEIQRMLEDVHNKVNGNFGPDWELNLEKFAERQAEWAQNSAAQWERHAELLQKNQAMHDQALEAQMEAFEKSRAVHLDAFEKSHEAFEKSMKAFEEKNRFFEEKMKQQLIEDGYLGKDEKLESMHWHNGKIEINGKKIRPEDEKKYNEIHEKYFDQQLRKPD
ncbi:MAG TPA: M56 family metallopeptidase [Chryseolinea sp.]